MGSNHYREQYYKKEWTKQIDISLLYQLQILSDEMKRRAVRQQDKELEKWSAHIRLMLATVNGEVANIKLDDKQLPDCGLQDLVNVATDQDQPPLRLLTRPKNSRA